MNDKIEKRKEYQREYYRKYRLEHAEYFRQYRNIYYHDNKLRIKQGKLMKYAMSLEDIDMIERQKLIDKIDNQRGFVDYIDCYRIINVYCNMCFGGENIDQMNPMDQIVLMYDRIKNYKKEEFYICKSCNKLLPSYCFFKYKASKSGFNHKCKSCTKEYRIKLIEEGRISDRKIYNKEWREINKDKCEEYIKKRKIKQSNELSNNK